MRIAAIDIGSNSTRLLLADVVDGEIAELSRESIVTRLGDGVDASGALNEPAMARVADALEHYRGAIERAGAERVGAVATSAVRDAANGAQFAARLAERFGFPVDVIDGDREAQLTFAGAATGGALGRDGRTLVADIGGGSTEFIVGELGALRFHVSTRLGCVRQGERLLHSDPPTAGELEALLDEATLVIRRGVPAEQRAGIVRGIGVAGTPTSLAAVDLALDPFDPWKVHGHALTLGACESLLTRLAALPLASRREVVGLHPDRAPTIVAGAAILLASLRAFDLPEIVVSERDLLYGMALELAGG